MRTASFTKQLIRAVTFAFMLAATALFLCALRVNAAQDSGLLWLVNCENPLPETFVPNDMISYQNNARLHPAAAEAFAQLTAAMAADKTLGNAHQALFLHSAYRPYERQAQLHAQKIRHFARQGHSPDEAKELAAHTVQPPGASEHQTGLALDVSTTGSLNQRFGDTPVGQWLAAHAHRFGFIIRYPASKTHTTQIIYEPWHLRFVGVPHAAVMYARDLTLEEYSDFLAAHSPYTFHADLGETYVIHRLSAPPDVLPAGAVDLSADRFGSTAHYILTLRKNVFTFPPQPDIVDPNKL